MCRCNFDRGELQQIDVPKDVLSAKKILEGNVSTGVYIHVIWWLVSPTNCIKYYRKVEVQEIRMVRSVFRYVLTFNLWSLFTDMRDTFWIYFFMHRRLKCVFTFILIWELLNFIGAIYGQSNACNHLVHEGKSTDRVCTGIEFMMKIPHFNYLL